MSLDLTIREAMKKMSQIGEKCLVAVDDQKRVFGTLSDGDIRKAILKNVGFDEPISSIYNPKPITLPASGYSKKEAISLFKKGRFDLIPIINEERVLTDILFFESVLDNETTCDLNVPVVIMAGGKGTRMEPFTKVLPKPLLPIHDKPIIEHIIERFTNIGCTKFYLTVNYKGRVLKAYFEELEPNYNVHFIDESSPLGTAGCLHLLRDKFNEPFFVSNCDILINANYANLYDFHVEGSYDMTLVASVKEYLIPYGVCEIDSDGQLSHINEKPSYDLLINTGLYVLNPEVLELIPENTFFHITHLIEKANDQGMKVGVFPIDDHAWLDVGQWTEYKKTVASM